MAPSIRSDQATKIGHVAPYSFKELSDAGVAVLDNGNFLTILINFIILALIIFWMVKMINRAKVKGKLEPVAAPTPEDTILLREIRDALNRP